ncbi:MAG TPA: alcohol dehydrogenase catalytic domain-containing protein [Chloroflexi bacterium]|nr:alcohol dehydrogenase catalytic domain-containing protein [Chloroflexota bacterium]
MKAVVVRAPMAFDVEEVPAPETPAGGLLLDVKACGLCGSDLRTLRSGHRKVTLPYIIGHEICGVVAETGPGYAGPWQVGDLLSMGPVVYCGHCDFCLEGQFELCENYREIAQAWPGGLAEQMAVPPEAIRLGVIERVPAGVDPGNAAIAEPISSCLNAQERGRVGLGDTVVIIGSGPIGCIHIALARLHGADRVIIADINAERLRLAAPFEPDAAIDVSQTDLVSEVRRLTNGKGADVIVTATPAPAAVVQAVEMARKGGRILLFGGLPKDDSKPPVDMNLVHYNALALIGATTFAPRHYRLAVKLVASNRIPVDKLITHRLPLAEFKQGAMMALEGKVLKAVFMP